MAQMIKTVRLVDGRFRLTLITETETGRLVVLTPSAFWRRCRRQIRELGGVVPRPVIERLSARSDGLAARRSAR